MGMFRYARSHVAALGLDVKRLLPFERAILPMLLSQKVTTFAQIGAHDGISHDSLYWYVTRHKTRGIVVEPLPDLFSKLEYNYRQFDSIKPVRYAIHPSLDRVTLHRVNPDLLHTLPAWADGTTSLDPEWHTRSGLCTEAITRVDVPAKHLMNLLIENDLVELDILQLDLEGFDCEAIGMIDFSQCKPRVIKFEMWKRHEDAIRLLKANEYRLHFQHPDAIAIRKG